MKVPIILLQFLLIVLDAESVTIWKDVPGVLNADPRYFENAILLNQISYREAIELAFYGASVIHPKTLQPLQKKEIPLYVKSFINPLLPGTSVSQGADLEPHIPCYIVKKGPIVTFAFFVRFFFYYGRTHQRNICAFSPT